MANFLNDSKCIYIYIGDDAIVEIEKMKNKVKIKEIKFDFTKVDGDDISKFCKINQRKIIEFVERFLNSCVCFWGKHNKMTCVVSTDIQETDKTQHCKERNPSRITKMSNVFSKASSFKDIDNKRRRGVNNFSFNCFTKRLDHRCVKNLKRIK